MNLARKLALTVVATVMGTSFLAVTAAPAHAWGDSSWGCGGMCRPAPVQAP